MSDLDPSLVEALLACEFHGTYPCHLCGGRCLYAHDSVPPYRKGHPVRDELLMYALIGAISYAYGTPTVKRFKEKVKLKAKRFVAARMIRRASS